MAQLFQTILYQPIFNIFVALYNVVGDVGVVILIITVVIKLALWPLTAKAIRAQKSLQELQPKMQELKEKYKDDQQRMAQETMALYKDHKVNPLGSCLPVLIQIPIFLALYWVLRNGLTTTDFSLLYGFVTAPDSIHATSLGIIDLAQSSVVLAIAAAGAQYWHASGLSKKRPPQTAGQGGKDEDMMAVMNKQMLYVMPVLTLFISASLPGGVALYWFLSTLLSAIQQKMIFSKHDKNGPHEGENVIDGTIVS